jgi:excisionase family DNA binding protein
MDENRVSFSRVEFAKRLGVSRDSVNRALLKGKVKFIRFGRRILIPATEIERLFKEAK